MNYWEIFADEMGIPHFFLIPYPTLGHVNRGNLDFGQEASLGLPKSPPSPIIEEN